MTRGQPPSSIPSAKMIDTITSGQLANLLKSNFQFVKLIIENSAMCGVEAAKRLRPLDFDTGSDRRTLSRPATED